MTLPEQDIELCGCGCGEAAVVNDQLIWDSYGVAQQEPVTGEWWLAECRMEAEMALRCP